MSLPILLKGDPILETPCTLIPDKDIAKYKGLAAKLISTCKSAKGAGLAAPQVGAGIRLIVTNLGYPLVYVNPSFEPTSEETVVIAEGCLSIPGVTVNVTRHKEILVSYQDLDGKYYKEVAKSPLSIVLQHEIDHLNGILITHYKDTADAKASETGSPISHDAIEATPGTSESD